MIVVDEREPVGGSHLVCSRLTALTVRSLSAAAKVRSRARHALQAKFPSAGALVTEYASQLRPFRRGSLPEDRSVKLPPPFPPRNVEVKEDVDMRKYYDLKKEIGRGRFGTVYLVTDKTTGQKFAAKFVNTKRNQDRANVEREVEIMKLLNAERPHPRLIQLYDAFDMDKEMCLVLEVVDGGELFERVIDDDFVLTEKACAIFMRQVCEAVEFIHSKNILHLDMKPENILCLSREGNRIKICDFGLARKYDPRKKLQVLFGTPEFVAPEVVNFEPISFGTDMWSVGVISYVLLSGLIIHLTIHKTPADYPAFYYPPHYPQNSRRLSGLLLSTPLSTNSRRLSGLLLSTSYPQTPADYPASTSLSTNSRRLSGLYYPPHYPQTPQTIRPLLSTSLSTNSRRLSGLILSTPLSTNSRRLSGLLLSTHYPQTPADYPAFYYPPHYPQTPADYPAFYYPPTIHKLPQTIRPFYYPPHYPQTPADYPAFIIHPTIHKLPQTIRPLLSTSLSTNSRRLSGLYYPPHYPQTPADYPFYYPPHYPQTPADYPAFYYPPHYHKLPQTIRPFIIHPHYPQTPADYPAFYYPPHYPQTPADYPAFYYPPTIHKLPQTIRPLLSTSLSTNSRRLSGLLLSTSLSTNSRRLSGLLLSTSLSTNSRRLSGLSPFMGHNYVETMTNVTHNKYDFSDEAFNCVSDDAKDFIEKLLVWNSHPNSPYLIGTPLTQLPPELQRIAREEGWSSRASFSNKDEFSHYTFEQRQPSPRRLASQLEVKLSQLKEDNDGRKDKDQDKAGVDNEKINKKASDTLPSDKHKKDDNDKLSVSKPEKNEKLEKERSKTPEITKKENEKNKKTEETHETAVKSKDNEKPTGGLQKCSSTVFLDDPKKAYQEYQKMVNEAIKKKQEEKKALEERIKARQEELEREASKDYDWRKNKEKKETTETRKTSVTNYLKAKEATNVADEKRSRGSKSPVSVYSSTKATDEQLDDNKQAYEDYKRRVSRSEKDAKKTEDAGKAKPREPLRRPEIIALQNEELGGSTARQRKKSLSRLDTGDSLSDRSSRGSTPKSPGLDGATSPKYDFDLEAGQSRSSTPTKLKKQPSRDVPLQAKNTDQEERPGTPVRQKPSRDVPMPYITVEGEDRYSRPRRGSRDLTPDSPLPHRKISTEERPPSRESRPGTPLSHRRPSRDVNISSGQLDRLVQASGLDSPELTPDQPQMWPDLIVCPQGQDDEECQDYKDSLDVPIATLMKSPSGTLRQVPEVTILQTDKSNASESKTLDSEGNSNDPTYVPSNKLVAWILDIGNVQNQRQAPFSTSDRVSQWEGKEPSPKPGERSPREKSPRLSTRSPVPSDKHRDKSPAQPRTPFLCPLSREPSSVSLKSSGSLENACIQTPWGELKRSPSRSTLSKSPSFEVPSSKAKDSTDPGNGGSDDHMSVGSSTRSPSPRSYSKFHKQDSMEIQERKDSLTSPRLTGELPPKPPEKMQRSSKEENLNIRSQAKKDDWKSATLPRQAKLAKQGSTDNLKNYTTEKRSSLLSVEEGNTDSLKRKSKFPPSPNQKRKLGSCLLFSAQDRISQFEKKQPSTRPPQRPITRTRSSMVFTTTAQENGLENRLSCDVNKNALTSSLNSSYTPTRRPPPVGPQRSPTFTY
ncbi:putative serine/threonine-protein kinase [Penaeus vannamei]|uniref:Putative serine/threonine-protein kinase n=1 Tax=Penaeus vannamei TaxID=6689 RepID=A0A423U3S2_PENVA|nr:putative serine/threonine-protein kinase [Penaeus vannamei]